METMKKIKKSSNKEAYEEEEELIQGLPICLAFDILSRIPSAKELSMFKCVSKFWRKSLSDPYLLSLHRSRSDQNPPFYCFVPIPFDQYWIDSNRRREEPDKEFDVTIHIQTADNQGQPVNHFTKQIKAHEDPKLSLLPAKQLVCLSTSYRIYICNPSTQDFVELPKGSALPFCLYNVGFGYLPCSNEYKVVRLFYTHYDEDPSYHRLGCEVMTISSTCTDYSWRVMKEDCPYAVDEHGSINVNEFVVWEVESAFLLGKEEEDNEYILSFNLEKEKFGTVPPPPCRKKDGFGLAGLRGNLWFVDYGEGPLIMSMWILKDWNMYEWLKQYSINFGDPEVWWARRPLDIIQLQGDDGEGEEAILVYARGKVHYYHVQSKSFTFLGAGCDYKFCYYHDSFFSLPRPN